MALLYTVARVFGDMGPLADGIEPRTALPWHTGRYEPIPMSTKNSSLVMSARSSGGDDERAIDKALEAVGHE